MDKIDTYQSYLGGEYYVKINDTKIPLYNGLFPPKCNGHESKLITAYTQDIILHFRSKLERIKLIVDVKYFTYLAVKHERIEFLDKLQKYKYLNAEYYTIIANSALLYKKVPIIKWLSCNGGESVLSVAYLLKCLERELYMVLEIYINSLPNIITISFCDIINILIAGGQIVWLQLLLDTAEFKKEFANRKHKISDTNYINLLNSGESMSLMTIKWINKNTRFNIICTDKITTKLVEQNYVKIIDWFIIMDIMKLVQNALLKVQYIIIKSTY